MPAQNIENHKKLRKDLINFFVSKAKRVTVSLQPSNTVVRASQHLKTAKLS
jgi:hypothetical protein